MKEENQYEDAVFEGNFEGYDVYVLMPQTDLIWRKPMRCIRRHATAFCIAVLHRWHRRGKNDPVRLIPAPVQRGWRRRE